MLYTPAPSISTISNGVFATIAKDHRAIAMVCAATVRAASPTIGAYGDELARDVAASRSPQDRARILSATRRRDPHAYWSRPIDRLASVAFIGHHPDREISAADATFVDSIRELESDLPFDRWPSRFSRPARRCRPTRISARRWRWPLQRRESAGGDVARRRVPAHQRCRAQGARFPMIEIIGTLNPRCRVNPCARRIRDQDAGARRRDARR